MPHPRFSGEEIARRGEEIYDRAIRERVETEENIGKILSVDIETGDYEMGDDPLVTSRRLQARHPDAAIWKSAQMRPGTTSIGLAAGMLRMEAGV